MKYRVWDATNSDEKRGATVHDWCPSAAAAKYAKNDIGCYLYLENDHPVMVRDMQSRALYRVNVRATLEPVFRGGEAEVVE